MRAPFWITALLAALLALGVPVPGLAQDADEPTEQSDEDGEVVPGVPTTTFEEAAPPPPMEAPDLKKIYRRYRVGNTFFWVGAAGSTAGAGITWLGLQIWQELVTNGENFGEILVGVIFGAIFVGLGGAVFVAGVPFMAGGAGMSRGALRKAGLEVTGAPLIGAWVSLGAGVIAILASAAAESPVLLYGGAGAVVASVGLAVTQKVVNGREKRDGLAPRSSARLVPAAVGRSPGLVLAGRFW